MIEPLYVPSIDKVYVPIPKNAHGTLKAALKRRHPDWEVWDKTGDPEIVVMWREPRERFESAWRFLAQSTPNRIAPWGLMDFVEFAEHNIGSEDIHLRPQVSWEPRDKATRIPWDFRKFADVFDIHEPLEHRNPSERINEPEWSGHLDGQFRAYYHDDLRIWGRMDSAPGDPAQRSPSERRFDSDLLHHSS